jgi:hypothetical protein
MNNNFGGYYVTNNRSSGRRVITRLDNVRHSVRSHGHGFRYFGPFPTESVAADTAATGVLALRTFEIK